MPDKKFPGITYIPRQQKEAQLPPLTYICRMIFSSTILENAVNEFARLPGIGKKTALRLVLHLIKQSPAEVQQFTEAIDGMKKETSVCSRCNNIAHT